MWNQWSILDRHYRAGIQFCDSLLGVPASEQLRPVETVTPADRLAIDLERCALARTREGLAPPKEIYQVQNRERIDWMALPEWARPVDPEVFEGSAHEG